ncbi:MAG: hypothetical protein RIC14_08560 [Filomicrobium sp.]
MQTMGLAGLVAAFGVLAALLLSVLLYSTWQWWIKATATLGLLLFYVATYLSIPPLLGWPTNHDVPKQFRLMAFSVEENQGVYIWANDLSKGVQIGTPRAYVLPYNKLLHEDIEIAGAKLKRGINIIGEVTTSEPPSSPQSADKKTGRKIANTVTFLEAPEALIPRHRR